MDFLSRLFGGGNADRERARPSPRTGANRAPMTDDERAISRYHYLLRTAPPETLEQAHADAFAHLTPEQRRMVLQDLSAQAPDYERDAYSDDPRSLGRLATRLEQRQPGTLERSFAGMGGPGRTGMPGMGSMMAGSFLSTVAGVMVGSAIANAFLSDQGVPEGAAPEEAADMGDAGFDGGEGETGSDFGDGGGFGGDFGGFGDFGGDFGGDF